MDVSSHAARRCACGCAPPWRDDVAERRCSRPSQLSFCGAALDDDEATLESLLVRPTARQHDGALTATRRRAGWPWRHRGGRGAHVSAVGVAAGDSSSPRRPCRRLARADDAAGARAAVAAHAATALASGGAVRVSRAHALSGARFSLTILPRAKTVAPPYAATHAATPCATLCPR
jgi:hypothetical protein